MCDFPRGGIKEDLFIPDTTILRNQSSDYQVQLGEPMSLLLLHMGAWLRGYIQVQV